MPATRRDPLIENGHLKSGYHDLPLIIARHTSSICTHIGEPRSKDAITAHMPPVSTATKK